MLERELDARDVDKKSRVVDTMTSRASTAPRDRTATIVDDVVREFVQERVHAQGVGAPEEVRERIDAASRGSRTRARSGERTSLEFSNAMVLPSSIDDVSNDAETERRGRRGRAANDMLTVALFSHAASRGRTSPDPPSAWCVR